MPARKKTKPAGRLPARSQSRRPPRTHAPTTPTFEAFAVRIDPRTASSLKRLASRTLPGGVTVRAVSPELGEYHLVPERTLLPGRAWTLARALRNAKGVEDAEPLFEYAGLEPDAENLEAFLAPHELPHAVRAGGGERPKPCAANNPRWSLETIRAAAAWQRLGIVRPGNGVRIGHPDTGYTQHPEIWGPGLGSVLADLGYDFVNDDPDALDPLTSRFAGRGGATGSVILSPTAGLVSPGVTGVAPAASLVPMRVSTSVIHLSFARLTRAIHQLVDNAGVHLISMSLGGPFPSNARERALLHAIEEGVIPLAAAGNVWPFVVYPAKYEQVVAVGASNCEGHAWKKSARGGAIDISAPGESVWRAAAEIAGGAPSYSVSPGSGTSFAVATAAGACAVWLTYHGHAALYRRYGATLADVFRRLVNQVAFDVPSGWDTRRMGPGVLNLDKLLDAPLPVSAAGVRSRAPKGVLESALDCFPEDDPDRVVGALTRGIAPPRGGRASAVRNAFARRCMNTINRSGESPPG